MMGTSIDGNLGRFSGANGPHQGDFEVPGFETISQFRNCLEENPQETLWDLDRVVKTVKTIVSSKDSPVFTQRNMIFW